MKKLGALGIIDHKKSYLVCNQMITGLEIPVSLFVLKSLIHNYIEKTSSVVDHVVSMTKNSRLSLPLSKPASKSKTMSKPKPITLVAASTKPKTMSKTKTKKAPLSKKK